MADATKVQPNTPLIEAIQGFCTLDRSRFHVPGHGGKPPFGAKDLFDPRLYAMDLSEVDGLGVLADNSEALKAAQEAMAQCYGVRQSFFLINGSTVGIMALMLAAFHEKSRILIPRNAHRSVINGLILTGAEPVWCLPQWNARFGVWGPLLPETVEQALTEARANGSPLAGVLVTSPTYEGFASNIQGISDICRAHGALCLVDEAHGSLWPFSNQFPSSAISQGADAIVHSLHKSAGSLTQTAVLHLPHGSRMEGRRVQDALNVLQSTSPSYPLLASLDQARQFLQSSDGRHAVETLLQRVHDLYTWAQNHLHHLHLISVEGGGLVPIRDVTRLFLRAPNIDGMTLGTQLEHDEGISYEATHPSGVLYVAGIGLQAQDFQRMKDALLTVDRGLYPSRDPQPSPSIASVPEPPFQKPAMGCSPRVAFFAPSQAVEKHKALGRIAKNTLVHCPPGIPILLPGETLHEGHLPMLPSMVDVLL